MGFYVTLRWVQDREHLASRAAGLWAGTKAVRVVLSRGIGVRGWFEHIKSCCPKPLHIRT